MKIGLAGWGVETKSAYLYFGEGNDYVICNEHRDPSLPTGPNIELSIIDIEKTTGDSGSFNDSLEYLQPLESCDLIIYTPVSWNNLNSYFKDRPALLDSCKTVLHIFLEKIDQNRLIAVTGTKGKSTVSTLIYEMLRAANKQAYLGGNIGNSPLEFINPMSSNPEAICVLELSSYQLNNLILNPKVAVLLPISPEHIDWHGNYENYVSAKSNITTNQTSDNYLVFDSRNVDARNVSLRSRATLLPYPTDKSMVYVEESIDGNCLVVDDGSKIVADNISLKGVHNLYNIEAAAKAYSIFCGDTGPVIQVIKSFTGLPHRLEYVASIDGVDYYNDSIACTPEASLAGIRSFSGNVITLIGGHDRGLDLTGFVFELEKLSNLKQLVVFGEVKNKLAEIINKTNIPYSLVDKPSMKNAMAEAIMHATGGDTVLLSPGFSSYDEYIKYSVRGDEFKVAVATLSDSSNGGII